MEDLIRIARARGWPGYLGSPRLARRSQYIRGWQAAGKEAIKIALKILGGYDERQILRFGEEMKKSEPDVLLDEESLKHEAEVKRKQDEWLNKKGLQ